MKKLANVKSIFWSFSGQIRANVILELHLLKNTEKKIEKMPKFRKIFFNEWVLSTLNYHLVSIWSIFKASKASNSCKIFLSFKKSLFHPSTLLEAPTIPFNLRLKGCEAPQKLCFLQAWTKRLVGMALKGVCDSDLIKALEALKMLQIDMEW
jgi:hypothetical protein